jgi:hypothetical protein
MHGISINIVRGLNKAGYKQNKRKVCMFHLLQARIMYSGISIKEMFNLLQNRVSTSVPKRSIESCRLTL